MVTILSQEVKHQLSTIPEAAFLRACDGNAMQEPKTKPLVLLVDDSAAERAIVKELLEGNGLQVLGVDTATKAVTAAISTSPHVILLDVVLPDFSGYQACRMLKSDRRTRQIPIIFITSQDKTTDLLHGFKSGGSDYINKPFNPDELIARVKAQLEPAMVHQQRLKEQEMILLTQQYAQQAAIAEGLAHNLNNLLTPLSGNLSWFVEQLPKGEHREAAREMMNVVRRLERIVEALTARPASVHLDPLVSVGSLLSKACQRFSLGLPEKVALTQAFKGDDPRKVHKDIETPLLALLVNAQEAVAGSGEIEVQVNEEDLDTVEIRVIDNGRGLSQQVISRAFLPFFSTKRTIGVGLGLYTAKLVVERQGGQITLDNGPARGAVAVIRVPVVKKTERKQKEE